jgi:hypothetical protein
MTARDTVAKAMSEEELQGTIIEMAEALGWKVHRARKSAIPGKDGTWRGTGPKGWPDLFMVFPATGRALAVELKREGKSPTAEQRDWLSALESVAGISVHVYRPSDLLDGTVQRILGG